MYDVVALGECLIDFAPAGKNEWGMQLFSRNPGGAPANVLAMLAKLGDQTAFIGKVGRDAFGAFLEETLLNARIDTRGLCKCDEAPTTLAFVQLDERGDRSFTFYRKPGADVLLSADEVPASLAENCRIFHFGSVSMTAQPARDATLSAARRARAAGALISYDPNYRPALWERTDETLQVMREGWKLADIIKVSDEEMALLTGCQNLAEGVEALSRHGATLVLVTGGEKGACYRTEKARGIVPAYLVNAADTTGAGDAFLGALLHQLMPYDRSGIAALDKKTMEEMLRFANAAGGWTATAPGAIPAMPDEEKIRSCMQTVPLNTECMFSWTDERRG